MACLHRKLLRDLVHMSGQAIAIALILSCGVAAFVTMRAMYRSLLRSQVSYYSAYRFGDVFAELKRAPIYAAERAARIAGVADAEPRLISDVILDVPGLQEPATGRLISLSADPRNQLNGLFLRQGRYVEPESDDEVVASEAFATANQLHLGTRLSTVVNGHWQSFRIVGIALSPEYIYEIRGGGSVFPDNKRFGVLWTTRRALEDALQMKGAFNSISLTLQPGAREAAVIAHLDRILEPYGGLGAYGRSEQISHRFISDEIAQNRVSAVIVPLIFFGVSAVLLHFSFTRLVNIQRSEIGTLKAFGYSNWQVGVHYLEFSLAIAAIGYGIGCVVGWFFGIKLASLYADYYRFPILTYSPELRIFVWAGLLAAAPAAIGASAAVLRAAKLSPAESMRPEAPAVFRVSVVDRFRATFTSPEVRMMFRNVERSPLRTIGSVLAICCAVMITIVEMGMFDSLDRMLELQFQAIQREDMTVVFTEARPERAIRELERYPGVIVCQPFRAVPVRLRFRHRWKTTTLFGVDRGSDLRRIVDTSGNPVPVPPDGLAISTALAKELGAETGDRVTLETLVGRREKRDIAVSRTVDDPFGTAAYSDLEQIRMILREDHVVSGAYLRVESTREQELFRVLKQVPAISAVSLKQAALDSSRDTINRSMKLSLGTLLAFACVIAGGIVYNGARIALSERGRELATLRVLGFTTNEITFVLLGEQGVTTLIGIPFGFASGYALCAMLSARLQTELYRMPLVVDAATYAWAFVIVLIASVVSGALVYRKIAALDIVSVLKARE